MKHWSDIELIAYLDDTLDYEKSRQIQKQLEDDSVLTQRIKDLQSINQAIKQMNVQQPSPRLKENFYLFLEEEKKKQLAARQRGAKVKRLRWITSIAASLVLILTSLLVIQNYTKNKQIDGLHMALSETKKSMLESMNSTSTSARIQAVNQAYEFEAIDRQILSALVETFETDPNALVRLAALDAVSSYASQNQLKELLIRNLDKEKDASVQITMIQILTKLKSPDAVPSLEELLKQEDVLKEVKGEAQMSLYKLNNYQKM